MNEKQSNQDWFESAQELGHAARDIKWLASVFDVEPPIEADLILNTSLKEYRAIAMRQGSITRDKIEEYWDKMHKNVGDKIEAKMIENEEESRSD